MSTASNVSVFSAGTSTLIATGGSVGYAGTYHAPTIPNLSVTGIAGTDGTLNVSSDITIKGQSLSSWMQSIDERLLILRPKPELLEKYESLREAYEHYKTLEALLHEDTK